MKILLHMGQSKTGTSSLQDSLTKAADQLRTKRVFYPPLTPGRSHHHLLMSVFGQLGRVPPWLLDFFGGEEAATNAFNEQWAKACQVIRDEPIELLILSSELLIHQTDGQHKSALAEFLKPLSDDITPVVYIRHPVDHYKSRVQQWLKNRDRPFPPWDLKLQQAVLDTEAAFGQRAELVTFDRKTLHGGDIIQDFAVRFLKAYVKPEDLPSVRRNVGLSAEALVLMSQTRAELGGTYEAARQVVHLIRLLEKLDVSDPPSQPITLLPEVAETALRTATGHRWLVETGRLQIPGLDLDRIDGAPVPDWMRTAPAASLILHDPDRLERLREAVKYHQSKKSSRKPQAKPSEKPKPRIQDLLLRFLFGKLASLYDRNTGAVPQRTTSVQGSSQGERNEDH
jgi:hypothetical protein